MSLYILTYGDLDSLKNGFGLFVVYALNYNPSNEKYRQRPQNYIEDAIPKC